MESSSKTFAYLKCFNVLTINIAFLVIAVVLYLRDSPNYGQIVASETAEWDLTPIVEVIDLNSTQLLLNNGLCPSGYESANVDFTGT